MQRFTELATPATGLLHGFFGTAMAAFGFLASAVVAEQPQRPNIVVIFTDDQGYGDLGCYGSEGIRTPRIDQLARQGTRFTDFYAQVVCGPSRSALLTGRYPIRSLGWSMPGEEVTIAEQLAGVGYSTACIGKWDVSNRAEIIDRMPNAQGFEYFWGTLGANDNGRVVFHENTIRVGESSDMSSLTRLYTDKSIAFIREQKDRPFFLYLAHTMVHSVIDASPAFKGNSRGGLYGDVVEELDFETGRLLDAIDELGLRENTLVVFTSDNGPWSNFSGQLARKHNGQIAWGSSGPLRGAKGSTYEGGIRVPCIARWPGRVPENRVSDAIFATIDFLPTFARLCGYSPPTDRIIDGVDQSELLLGSSEEGARDHYHYFCRGELQAVRDPRWKLLLAGQQAFYPYVKDRGSNRIELYDLSQDVGETRNVAEDHPEVVRALLRRSASVTLPDQPYDAAIGMQPRATVQEAPIGALPQGDWSAHSLTAAQRERIREAFETGIKNQFLPGGSLMLIHRGEVILKEGFGLADLDTRQPFLDSAPCRIASLTKPHTATLITLMADRGLLSLDETIDRYLPEFGELRVVARNADTPRPVNAAPTLRQCLSHTAGFPGNDDLKSGAFEIELHGTLDEAVRDLAKQELLSEPGTRFAYSRLGFMVAGRVAEVVTGRPFAYLMRQMLLEPIGASEATFIPTPSIAERLPTAYVRQRRGFAKREGEPLGSVINPGGSMVSTLDDVGRLLLLHRNQGRVGDHQLISEASLKEMYTPAPASRGAGYGLGFNIMQRRADGTASRVRHLGASGTVGLIDFDRDLIVVVFTQVPSPQTTRWRDDLLQTLSDTFSSQSDN